MLYLLFILLAISGFSACWFFGMSFAVRSRGWVSYRYLLRQRKRGLLDIIGKLLWIRQKNQDDEALRQLLLGSGVKLNTEQFLLLKRLLLAVSVSLGVLALVWLNDISAARSLAVVASLLCSLAGIAVVLLDKQILQLLKKRRSDRIVQEVYALCHQLLYYSGSHMNLHSKLMKCIAFTKTIRSELVQLTTEWYEGAEQAIENFKLRLGTNEGISFAETLNSLRLYESPLYYDLLRQRMNDYKEKMELNQESKKETSSYVLFVLAGIPILNTFRVFIYPWVQEGQRLFESLN